MAEERRDSPSPTPGVADPRLPELIPGPKKIIIAVDDSTASEYALKWYVANLHRDGNQVIVIHSFEVPFLHSYQEMYVPPEMWQASLKKEADKARNLEKKCEAFLGQYGIPCRFLGRGGKPGEVIIKAAEEEDADTIVVGSRTHSKLHRVLMGSVSNYVTHHAHCPVVVCRPKAHEQHRHADQHQHHQHHHHGTHTEPGTSGQPRTHTEPSTNDQPGTHTAPSDSDHLSP